MPSHEFTGKFHEAYCRAFQTYASWLAVFQITDIPSITAHFNTPGSITATNSLPSAQRRL